MLLISSLKPYPNSLIHSSWSVIDTKVFEEWRIKLLLKDSLYVVIPILS